jgi:hypothetical protein
MSKLAKKVLLIALLITIVSLSLSAILIYLNQDNILENIVIND